jgi:hypothetical protein
MEVLQCLQPHLCQQIRATTLFIDSSRILLTATAARPPLSAGRRAPATLSFSASSFPLPHLPPLKGQEIQSCGDAREGWGRRRR